MNDSLSMNIMQQTIVQRCSSREFAHIKTMILYFPSTVYGLVLSAQQGGCKVIIHSMILNWRCQGCQAWKNDR